MRYIKRDENDKIIGTFHNNQGGQYIERLDDNHPEILAFNNRALNEDIGLGLFNSDIGVSVQAEDAALTSIATLATAPNKYVYTIDVDTFIEGDITVFGRSLIDDASAIDARMTLGLGIGIDVQAYDTGLLSIASLTTTTDTMIYTTELDTYATTPITTFGRSLIDDASAIDACMTLGLEIGIDVQAYDAGLNSISNLETISDTMIYTTELDTYATTPITVFGRSLIDDASATDARSTLGLEIGIDVQAYDVNNAVLNIAQTYTAAQRYEVKALTDAEMVVIDMSTSNNFSVTIAGNRIFGNPYKAVAGQSGFIVVTQDDVGSRTFSYSSSYVFEGGIAPSLTATPDATDRLYYYVETPTRIHISSRLDWKA